MNFWHDVRLMNLAANTLSGLALLTLAAGGLWWAANRPAFALTTIVVEPADGARLRHMSEPLLRSAAVHRVQGTFFTVDLEAVRERFEQVSWVRRAQVRRIWPNALRIGIEEHEPLATWADGRLVNRQGELFVANVAEAEEERELLEFSGPADSEAAVTRRWADLSRRVEPLGAKVVSVVLSPRQAWSARLDNGTLLPLGRDQEPPLSDRVDRWVALHPQVQRRLNRHVETVDLRYPNGFAVQVPGALEPAVPLKAVMRTTTNTNPKDKRPQ